MTKELLEKANDLNHDISVLEDIKAEQDKNHWVGFRVSGNPVVDSFLSREIREDFKEFVRLEIEKAREMFKELGEKKMTKDQENALNHLKRLVGILIYPDDVKAIMVGIQAIEDLDKMNGIALDLAFENDDLIEKLDAIRAEIEDAIDCKEPACKAQDNFNGGLQVALQIIDKYRKGGE